ncbi:MAG: LysM peptidoglycan-binding domain-containing protein [Bacteroidota bacterium]|nr:LysM peptidoglycan-binding domain-containing protein [Bacteroidota bacterium]
MKKRFVSLFTVLLVLVFGKLFISSSPNDPEDTSAAMSGAGLFNEESQYPYIHFCGEDAPLEKNWPKKQFERELKAYAGHKAHAAFLIGRANAYFPVIAPILRKHGIPDDFKYLPLIESAFLNNVSSRGAAGPWQILPRTARAFGLVVNDEVDERYNLQRSTEAACKYLKAAYRVLGNWTLVAAAYNYGTPGLQGKLRHQRGKTFYDLKITGQTTRYIYKLLAVKEVIENPKRYKLKAKGKSYTRIPSTFITINTSVDDLRDLASAHGITYKAVKTLNPWMRGNKLSNPEGKVFMVRIPKNKNLPQFAETPAEDVPVNFFSESEKNLPAKAVIKKKNSPLYTVRSGDNLYTIGKRNGVTAAQLKTWNNLKSDKLRPGQMLKIQTPALENETP